MRYDTHKPAATRPCSMCGRVSRLIEERRVTPESEHRISVAEVTRFYACANPACEYVAPRGGSSRRSFSGRRRPHS